MTEVAKCPLPGQGGDGVQPLTVLTESTLPEKGTSEDMQVENGSPGKPTEEQVCPEGAHSCLDGSTDTSAKGDNEAGIASTSSGGEGTENVKMLTKHVMEEEKKAEMVEEDEAKKEEEEIEERKQQWLKMDNETKEMRYKRLQLLLMKSNMYTEYLMVRMEKQKEEEKKKRERSLKKAAKEQQKSTKDVLKDGEASALVNKEEESSNKENESNRLGIPDEVQAAEVLSPRSSKCKMSLRAPVPKSALSSPNIPSPGVGSLSGSPRSKVTSSPSTPVSGSEGSQENPLGRRSSRIKAKPDTPDSTTKKGIKRKHDDDVKSPQSGQVITNFFQKSRKKAKTQDAEMADQDENKPVERASKLPVAAGSAVQHLPRVAEYEDDGTVVRPALFDGGTLRRYQVEGLNWLKVLFENGINGILADEMGLGKTIQVIALITQIITMGATGPFLIVAPLSTLPNWRAEFKRFASLLPVVFYHGAKTERGSIRRRIYKQHRVDKHLISPVVITSYDMALIDRAHLMHIEWTYMIVDEGHRLKNMECRLIKHLKTYRTAHRLLLTGTPLQNNLRELWSLLNFLIPEIFDDLGSFETWFDVEVMSDDGANEAIIQQEKKSNILGMLHQILTPFMLRRVKTDVDLKIPPKKELLVYAPLTQVQDEFYRYTVDRTILQRIEAKENKEVRVELSETGRIKRRSVKKVDYSLMIETDKDSKTVKNKKKDEEELDSWVAAIMENNKPIEKEEKKKQSQLNIRMQNIMMQLRKCCNHPYLLQYPLDEDGEYKIDENLVTVCGKMLILDRLLVELRKKKHKVLLFSQMTQMLNILEDFCIMRDYQYCRLDGSSSLEERQEGMMSFNTDENKFLYLLSTRAGGLGINLTGADTVIIYDSDWNPQNDLQAQDRCHRIGQTKPVLIYRLVTANTIDQKIVERAAAKRKLEKMIIHKGKFKSGVYNKKDAQSITPEELLDLLKDKDHSGTVRKGKNDCVLSEEDLAALMDRSDMWDDFQKILDGTNNEQPAGKDVLRTSSKESTKMYKVFDYDQGGTTKGNS